MDEATRRDAIILAAGVGVAALAGSPAQAADEPSRRGVIPPPVDADLFEKYGYSAALKAGGLLFVSGQVPTLADGKIPAGADDQAARVFEKIGLILGAAGLDFTDLVEMMSFHRDLHAQIDGFMKVRDRFVRPPMPTWCSVGVTALGHPDWLVEVKVIAALR